MKRLLRWTLISLATAGVVFVAGSWLFAVRLTGPRQCDIGPPPERFPHPIEPVTFTASDDETLSGWFVPAASKKGVVLLHGYTGTRKQMLPRAHVLRDQGYNVLLYDARACGESSGDRVSFGYHERHDLIAAVKLLRERGCTDISCLGVSQGGATILFAADDLPDLKCVICESVYDEMANAVDRRLRHYTLMPGWVGASLLVPFAERNIDLPIDAVKPIDHIGKVRCPILVISGECDDKTWPEDTRHLFDAAPEPKQLWMVPDARHQDLFQFPGYQDRMIEFLRHYL
ncbi:MAG TPA: alpha/beta fold hydrolase [Gemmataceae bacterium]|nr:alpha/beta fold hydrolase [Gemmataceae bacterium]